MNITQEERDARSLRMMLRHEEAKKNGQHIGRQAMIKAQLINPRGVVVQLQQVSVDMNGKVTFIVRPK